MKVGNRTFHITKVERHPEEGYWTARVGSVAHDRKYGSWQVSVRRTDGTEDRREALPVVAAKLQEVVKRLERGERLKGDETVEWPTGENVRPRITREGRDLGSLPSTPAQRRMPSPTPGPAMGPAEIAADRLRREKAGA